MSDVPSGGAKSILNMANDIFVCEGPFQLEMKLDDSKTFSMRRSYVEIYEDFVYLLHTGRSEA
jgi:hypothetical protein